jgi:GH24 family phage-related lysozyme (muramidase)
MQLSARGLDLIAKFEGLRLKAYPDPGTGNEPWTIGYGTTVYPDGRKVKKGDVITKAQALEYLQYDTTKFANAVGQVVGVPLNQNRFDSLVSFTYNVGISAFSRSTLLRKVNAREYEAASAEFDKWVYAAGRVLPGLVNRRKAERDLFQEPLAKEKP